MKLNNVELPGVFHYPLLLQKVKVVKMTDKNDKDKNVYEPNEQINITQASKVTGTAQRRALHDVQESNLVDTTKPTSEDVRQDAFIPRQNDDYSGPTLEDLRKLALKPTKTQQLINKCRSTFNKVKKFSADHELGTKASIGASYGLQGAMATASGAGTVLGFVWRHISGSYWKFRLNGAMSRRYHSDDSLTDEERETKRRLNWIKWGIGLFYLILLRYAWPVLLFALMINAIWSNFRYYWFSTNDPMIQLTSAVAEDFHKGAYSPKYYYFDLPLRLYDYGEQLESFLSSGASGPRSANIVVDPYVHLNTRNVPNQWSYADLTIDNQLKHNPVGSINQDELLNLSLLPMTAGNNGSWYWELGGRVRINLDALLNGESYDQTIEKISANEDLAGQFRELAGDLERKRQQAELEAQKAREAEELEEMKADVARRGLPDRVANMLVTIAKNKEDWGFSYWRVGNQGLTGNDFYVRCRMKLIGSNSYKSVQKHKGEIQTKFGRSVLFSQTGEDTSSFYLTVSLKSQLEKVEIKAKDLIPYANVNRLFMGNSLTGPLAPRWNNNANHALIAANTGEGKTTLMLAMLANLTMMKDYDYKNLIIASSSKAGDYAPFEKAGASVGAGLPAILDALKKVNAEGLRREEVFKKAGVGDLWHFNKKHPNEKMSRIILVIDELENAVSSPDKLSKEIMSQLVYGLNIWRSEGILFVGGAQTPQKKTLDRIMDKVTLLAIGNNKKSVTSDFATEITDYYSKAENTMGSFFLSTSGLDTKGTIKLGDTSYVQLQTPYIPTLSANDLPQLTGAEFMATAPTEQEQPAEPESTVGGSIDDFL